MSTKCNGFTNLVTWSVMCAISNNHVEYERWYGIAEELLRTNSHKEAIRKLADEIKDHFSWSTDREPDFLTAELIRAAASEINYTEIAASIIDDLE